LTYVKLFIASLKIMFRDWLTLFWGLAFPVMFVVIFGLFSFGEGAGSARLAIIDQADTESSRQLLAALQQIQFFRINSEITSEAAAKEALTSGGIEAAIIIPESFRGVGSENSPTSPIEFTVYYDRANLIEYQIVRSVLSQVFNEMNLHMTGAARLFALKEESLEARRVKYMDFLIPGIMGMGLMLNGIIGVAVDMTRYREQRILKRIRGTPLPPRIFIASQVLAYLVLVFIQATLILLVGTTFFGATIYGSLVNLYIVALVGTLIFLNLGFIVAGLTRTASGASGLAQVIGMPMMFLSGTFFSTDGLPAFMQSAVQFLPLTPLMRALRSVAINDTPLLSLGPELLYIGLWILVTFLMAARVFKFRAD
jgi:ABC-2 type transport system permease protein